MSENSERNDPWAPPENRAPQDRVDLGKTAPTPAPHDQPTVTSMPAAGPGTTDGADVPPPPVAPGGPAQPAPGPYGYPAPTTTQFGAAYGYPGAGYPGYAPYGPGGWGPAPANGLGVASMVLGIISLVGCWAYGLGIILGILALIFGLIGRKRVQRGEANNGPMATAGIVTGSVGIALGALVLGLIIWAIAQDIKNGGDSDWDSSSAISATAVVTDHVR
ncbi:DUF4190 domain-containing protein [Streptomyces coeruleoprunus]|uniref:DUF4190 domain-containing protein n=1 Tax=Streptomyces coeruleoprunus TaxID=285563 RepID=A0ABV9XD35_9ACTN